MAVTPMMYKQISIQDIYIQWFYKTFETLDIKFAHYSCKYAFLWRWKTVLLSFLHGSWLSVLFSSVYSTCSVTIRLSTRNGTQRLLSRKGIWNSVNVDRECQVSREISFHWQLCLLPTSHSLVNPGAVVNLRTSSGEVSMEVNEKWMKGRATV